MFQKCRQCDWYIVEDICGCKFEDIYRILLHWKSKTVTLEYFLLELSKRNISISHSRIFFHAMQCHTPPVIKYLLDNKIYNIRMKHPGFNYRTLFAKAFYSGQIDLCNQFIQEGCDVNTRDLDGRTILYYIYFSCNVNEGIFERLKHAISFNCDPFITDKYGMTPKDFYKNKDILFTLIEQYEKDYTNNKTRTTSLYDLLVK